MKTTRKSLMDFIWPVVLVFVIATGLVSAQERTIISGHVKDELGPLVGVNVVEIDNNGRFITGVTSDMDGNFSMVVTGKNATIQISYLGYLGQTIELNGMTRLDINLEQDSKLIDEVVVTADKMGNDGIISIRDRATAVSRLEMTDMGALQTASVEEMLQGRLSGVDIAASSGDPGAGVNIRIRGTASLNARNQPLILVNGIPYDTEIDQSFDFGSADIEQFGTLIDVAPENIESIEVLKDAASTAIWGSKAANGVLSIQTKRGEKSEPIFSYTFKLTTDREPDPIPMLNGGEYALLVKDAHFAQNGQDYRHEMIDFNPSSLDYHKYSQNTNWIEEITRVGNKIEHNFGITGGGDKTRYDMRVGYLDQKGTTIGTALKKINISTALDYDLSNKVKLKTDIMYTKYDQDMTYDQEDWGWGDGRKVRNVAYKLMPNMSVYERDTANNILDNYLTPSNTLQGNAKDYYNPAAFVNLGEHKRYQDNARALFNIRYNILSNLLFESTVTLDIFDRKFKRFLPYKAIGYNYTDDITNQAKEENHTKSTMHTINQFVFKPSLGDRHQFSGLLRARTEDMFQKSYLITTARAASQKLSDANGDVDISDIKSSSIKFRGVNFFTQAHYVFDEKYIATLGLGYEGSSKYSEASRWGYFPSMSVAWRASNESFLQNLRGLNDLKFRFSWGITGNMPNDNYLYFSKYKPNSNNAYLGQPGVRPDAVELTGLEWEKVEQINPGLSIAFLNNRVEIELDYYIKHTRDLYIDQFELPTTSGYDKIKQNNGEMLNEGWEMSSNFVFVKGPKFGFDLNFILSANVNSVLKMPENYILEYGNMLDNGNYKISIEPGRPIGGAFGYEYLGVYLNREELVARDKNGEKIYDIDGEPLKMIHGGSDNYEFEMGDAKYKDQNYDGVINELDLVYLADLNPDFFGSFGPRFSYKSNFGEFVLNGFFYFKVGQEIISQTRMDTEKMYNHDNQSLATRHRFRVENDPTDMPRALHNKGYNWMGSSRFVEDGSFMRLKTLSLAYTFPKSMTAKMGIKDLRVYVTGYNIYTWTKYSGQDPDVAAPVDPKKLPMDKSRTPPSKSTILGINITF
jgi:TonB-linked SusC/RagA family outer membrane protein